MSDALIGLVGVVVGAVLAGTGQYFTARRDAWIDARLHGLRLLADVDALVAGGPDSRAVSETRLGVASWLEHRDVLAKFRRGTYPNGFKASEWLDLAACFAELHQLDGVPAPERTAAWWGDAQAKFAEAERLLAPFRDDPRVLAHALRLG